MPPIDLSAVPLIDNHCHGVYHDPAPIDLVLWRSLLTEAEGPESRGDHVTTTLAYKRLVHHLARYFGCENQDAAVIEIRAATPVDEFTADLLCDARFEALVIDTGLPPGDEVYSHGQMEQMGHLRVAPLLRVEVLMQDLIAQVETLNALEEGLRHALTDVRAQGFVGLKSIVAYRTGLEIRTWPREEAEAAFAVAREVARRDGTVRLAHQPLLDTLLHLVFEQASRQELPVQFHTGYGDTDANMIRANPLFLRGVLDNDAYRGMYPVLLHESYPYTRQGGYLAAVYDRVYLDLSYAIPLLGYGEMETFTREAFGVAPYSKLLYSSDGVRIPELHWMSALDGRRILGTVLGEIVDSGDLTHAEAEIAGEAVLRGNAARLYGI
jgi:predicted TIM-barrel fold metal-dependent hydrolase